MQKKVIIIGAGIGGLASACLLAKNNFKVQIIEQHNQVGGRARIFNKKGFTFDIGPSWYMMPEVFSNFFKLFDREISDFFELKKLDPSYRIFFADESYVDITDDFKTTQNLFESIEIGAGKKFAKYFRLIQQRYQVAMSGLIYKPYLGWKEILNPSFIHNLIKLKPLRNYHDEVASYFKSPKLQKLIEWVVTFAGCSPYNASALYSLINYADLGRGIYYPNGGMYKLIEALKDLAISLGVEITLDTKVVKIITKNKYAKHIKTDKQSYECDLVLSNADYHFTESKLLEKKDQTYPEKFWQKKIYSPSTIVYFLGIKQKVANLLHHNFFFDTDWNQHFKEIFDEKAWPKNPMMYICASSKSDSTAAPKDMENIFVLIPVATGLKSTKMQTDYYYKYILDKLKKYTGQDVTNKIVVNEVFTVEDFIKDYNAYQGHAFGLANTLFQSAIFRPRIKSKKVKNLYYAGCMTNPGIGVPTSLISGEITAKQIIKEYGIS